MSRVVAPMIALCLSATSAAASGIPASNIAPLAFGMAPDEVAAALRAPLVWIKGRPGNEVLMADVDAGVPGFYPVGARLYLQFRRGHLTGWKADRRLIKPWLF